MSELSHDSLHTAQAVCDSVSFEDSCARWDQLGEALLVDRTLGLTLDAIQQEEGQMAQIMYQPTSLQSCDFIFLRLVLFFFLYLIRIVEATKHLSSHGHLNFKATVKCVLRGCESVGRLAANEGQMRLTVNERLGALVERVEGRLKFLSHTGCILL